jgi:2-amino-4-hydroxy-6-hydroxymethyldihydropteridine diphosphokinase
VRVAIGLGSNLGDRLAHLELGRNRLEAVLANVRYSSVYETEPVHLRAQPGFLNACCVGSTRLTATGLLRELQRVEREAGRRRGEMRYGPRELDLDILLYGEEIVDRPGLQIPHPRLAERAFALVPLAEIAAEWVHPLLERPITELAEGIDRSGVCRTTLRLGEADEVRR